MPDATIQMKPARRTGYCLAFLMTLSISTPGAPAVERVTIENGTLEGTLNSAVRSFKGIPFAQPPVGPLRWKPPVPPENWEGARKAGTFGPRAMQQPLFDDMRFRSDGMSEDCLYLNVWTPENAGEGKLPVLVYFFGGGFQAGDGSEFRYDGESMARRGIVTLTVNYRLNIFGFLAHPELSAESPHGSSGNYGLLDQYAALLWVKKNIAAFGGDPDRVTIAGESAGSISVSALMASPLSKDRFAGAIGESGSIMGTLPAVPLTEAEAAGSAFAGDIGRPTLEQLRAMPAEQLLEATAKPGIPWFPLAIDGWFLTKKPSDVFENGEQSTVPLLAGWNSEESSYHGITGDKPPTLENFESAVRALYPDHSEMVLKVYQAADDAAAEQAATDLAGDRFIGYSTWKWAHCHAQSKSGPVFRYYYARPRPGIRTESGDPPFPNKGAVHSAEIEYAMGNLPLNPVHAWTPDDHKVSATLQGYFENFIKTGDPNGQSLPEWPEMTRDGKTNFMRIDVESAAKVDRHADRYLLLDEIAGGK